MRFAKSCGFKGYADFKKNLQREVLLASSPATKMQAIINKNYSLNMEDLCKREQANIKESFENFDQESLEKALNLIEHAKDLYTLSWGISGHLAEVFAIRSRLIGRRCSILKRHTGTLLEETSHLTENDLVILFEFPPYSKEILETVEELTSKKVRIILVTDSTKCPVFPYSSVSFSCVTDTIFFGNSFVAPLFWVNLITSIVMDNNRDEALKALKNQQKYFNKNQYYQPQSWKINDLLLA